MNRGIALTCSGDRAFGFAAIAAGLAAAAGAVVGGIVHYATGRAAMRWFATAGGLLAVSGVTRMIEFFITQGTGGV